MTYSQGPGGYGGAGQGPSGQGYGAQPQGYTPATQSYGATPAQSSSQSPSQTEGQGKGLPFFLTIGVAALGLIIFLAGGFIENFFMPGLGLALAAGAVAALAMVPKQTAQDVTVAGLSTAAFLALVFSFISPIYGYSLSALFILVLVLSLVQAGLAIAVLLFSAGILKPPQPSQKQPQQQYGYYGQGGYGQGGYGQPAGYGQGGGYGQAPQAAAPPPPQPAPSQPTPSADQTRVQPSQPYYSGETIAAPAVQPPQSQPQPGQQQPPQQW